MRRSWQGVPNCKKTPRIEKLEVDLPLLLSCSSVSSSHTCEYASCSLVPVHSCCTRQLSNPYPPAVHASCMALAHAIIELQYNKAAGMPLYQLHTSFLWGSNSKRDHIGLGILCGTTQTSLKEIFAGQAHVDRLKLLEDCLGKGVMVFIALISTSLQPLPPTSWLPSTPQPFPWRVRAKRVVVAVPKRSLVTIILVRSPSNFIFMQFGCLLTAPKRKKLKVPNFIFLTKWTGYCKQYESSRRPLR